VLSDVVGERIAEIRRRLNVSRDDLAKRCTEHGWPMTAAILTNIETGRKQQGRRRREISIDEIAVIARALEIPPVLLCYPVGEPRTTEVAPGVEGDPWQGARWFCGEATLDGSDIGSSPGAAPVVMFRRHQLLVDAVVSDQFIADMIDYSGPEQPSSAVVPGFDYKGWLPERRGPNEETLLRLVELRREIRRAGLLPPELPGILTAMEAL
jgi:transcriptional regulator with XRE-family HTH domain